MPKGNKNPSGNPETMHCRKCGAEMENGGCPKCGYKVYVPMDEKKALKIRLILGGIILAGFIIWVIVTQVKG